MSCGVDAAFKAILDKLKADSVITDAVGDAIGIFPLNFEQYPRIGVALQTGRDIRYVGGDPEHTNMTMQVVVIGQANDREQLAEIRERMKFLLSKHFDSNAYGELWTMLIQATIDMPDPDEVPGNRIIRLGHIWRVLAK
jgi:hypothetical protein